MAKIFNKPVIYNATATVDGNEDNVQRVKGFVTANIVIKRTANTTITIGAAGSFSNYSHHTTFYS